MGRRGNRNAGRLFVLLGMIAVVFLALKAANLASFNVGPTYALSAQVRQHRRAEGAGAGQERRRHGRPGDRDRARSPELSRDW